MLSWRDGAAAQYNHVLSIMKDTMDKTLFVIDRWENQNPLTSMQVWLDIMVKNYNVSWGILPVDPQSLL
jgi:hypothetical protein